MYVVGIDEVGRGAIAGPVVACAVILPPDFSNNEIIDSKKIRPAKRIYLAHYLENIVLDYALGVICSEIIDRINILNATKQAMQLALSKIKMEYSTVITDAVKLRNIKVTHVNPIKAEDKFICVAAASIIAKVYRDNLMINISKYFPHYGWDKNMGYGTKEHFEAIRQFGKCYLHRNSFLGRMGIP